MAKVVTEISSTPHIICSPLPHKNWSVQPDLTQPEKNTNNCFKHKGTSLHMYVHNSIITVYNQAKMSVDPLQPYDRYYCISGNFGGY